MQISFKNYFLPVFLASALTKNPLNPMLSVSQVATPPTNNQLMTSAASTSVASPVTASVHGMNGSTGSPVVSSNGQTSSAMSTMLSSQSSGNQPVPEEKLNSRQQRKKQELLDHKHAGEQNLEREEKLEISGKDARYMMMQKLSRGAAVCV